MVKSSDRLEHVHSDIRGPLYEEALRMESEGTNVLKLNTGNPGRFGFQLPNSVRQALALHIDEAVPYCDVRGMSAARNVICTYHIGRGLQGIMPNDVFICNGVSEAASMILSALVSTGEEVLLPSPCYSLWSNNVYLSGGKAVFYRCDPENLWNPDLESRGYKGFIDVRNADGSFVFHDPAKWNGSWNAPFYEGRSWTYSYYVPHDMPRVIELMGGPEAFVERLNYGYTHKLTEYDNEPGFLTLRAFTEAGRPDLSSFWAHRLMDRKFTLKGYPDNEDTGSMGSWYAFCALGLFPNAGQDLYYLNAPKCRKAVLRLPRGRRLTIRSDAAPEKVIIRSCRFRGRPVPDARITHRELLRGGTLDMTLDTLTVIP